MNRISSSRPGEIAEAILTVIDRGLFEFRDWIELPPDVFTAADMRQELDRPECGIITGIAGWAAILTVPGHAELDMRPDAVNPFSTFLIDGYPRAAGVLARRALKLAREDAEWLFGAGRTLPELQVTLRSIAETAPAGKVPA